MLEAICMHWFPTRHKRNYSRSANSSRRPSHTVALSLAVRRLHRPAKTAIPRENESIPSGRQNTPVAVLLLRFALDRYSSDAIDFPATHGSHRLNVDNATQRSSQLRKQPMDDVELATRERSTCAHTQAASIPQNAYAGNERNTALASVKRDVQSSGQTRHSFESQQLSNACLV